MFGWVFKYTSKMFLKCPENSQEKTCGELFFIPFLAYKKNGKRIIVWLY